MLDSKPLLLETDFPPIARRHLSTVQVNLGYRCNQSCVHCHVDAGPKRREEMNAETMEQVLAFLKHSGAETLDITGGAPELNAVFRPLVEAARALGVHVMDRCNLTILTEPGQEDLAEFLAAHRVEIIASLPCYLEDNVDGQRGKGVFDGSIHGLRQLNALGYGADDAESTGLLLNLVYNPVDAVLPPPQCALEADYKRELHERYGIRFSRLLTLANMPIQRFGGWLLSTGRFDDYMRLLKGAHRDENLDAVMCRDLISIDWQGYVYDCDFNQMLGLPLGAAAGERRHISELSDASGLTGVGIRVGEHCFGCTAGQGSSCGGALS
ncbi:radical SAM protein [Thiohalocapsa halophila]|uniref:Radical SAM protein n=1 Tax=Thiohalocapsa halophila TaxID=69359 RepID=A0ABS1CEF9_9GAMM|nr:arsenosugar biosynthesis radical SAM (seleno)protein ArsS [Thiohalocapsa halophila]MBK1630103.1 radical SAM protein [Thiohalocapsa halophila]